MVSPSLLPIMGKERKLSVNGKTVGYALEAQNFTKDNYFISRPSAAGYNAAGSAGSNKGPTNPDYLKDVQTRIDSFLVHNKSIQKEQITCRTGDSFRKRAGSGYLTGREPISRFQELRPRGDCLLKKYIRSLNSRFNDHYLEFLEPKE